MMPRSSLAFSIRGGASSQLTQVRLDVRFEKAPRRRHVAVSVERAALDLGDGEGAVVVPGDGHRDEVVCDGPAVEIEQSQFEEEGLA